MSKTAKTMCAVVISVFTLVILFSLTIIVIEKTTNYSFFVNETFCIYCLSPFFMLWCGVFGDACTILTICVKKKAKTVLRVLSVAVIVISLISAIISSLSMNIVDRNFYYETSSDGNNEIIVASYQFLVTGGGDVYYRVNPFFICRLKNEENKHVEYFYDDYTVEWHDKYVIVDGYTYILPER